MAGFKIELRQIADPNALVDMTYMGEILYHVVGNRLCLCNGPDVLIFPTIDLSLGRCILPIGYSMSGYTNNYMQMSWDEHDALTISDIKTGLMVVRVSRNGSQVRMAQDAVYNRTGPQSIELFAASVDDSNFVVSYSEVVVSYRAGGNLWVEQNSSEKDIEGTVISLRNYTASDVQKGVRDLNIDSYAPQLYPHGQLSMHNTSLSSYLTGLEIKSRVYYPGAANMDITFFMLIAMTGYPANFATRIGWPGNWQTFFTEIKSPADVVQALSFVFRAEYVLPENRNKPINIDWVYNLICNHNVGTSVRRGIDIAAMMAVPGTITSKALNPSFHSFVEENQYAAMFGVLERTQRMIGREIQYVNFDVPMIGDDYTVTIHTSAYAVEISNKTRFGFVCHSSQAPQNASWRFTYHTNMK